MHIGEAQAQEKVRWEPCQQPVGMDLGEKRLEYPQKACSWATRQGEGRDEESEERSGRRRAGGSACSPPGPGAGPSWSPGLILVAVKYLDGDAFTNRLLG